MIAVELIKSHFKGRKGQHLHGILLSIQLMYDRQYDKWRSSTGCVKLFYSLTFPCNGGAKFWMLVDGG